MGCDIRVYIEVENSKGDWEVNTKPVFHADQRKKRVHPDFNRSYSVFGFLAGVRNYSDCEPISVPKGLPRNVSIEVQQKYLSNEESHHTCSFLTLEELLTFDYEQIFWDRRITKEVGPNHFDGAAYATEVDEGKIVTYREHVGLAFQDRLDEMKLLGDLAQVRMVFWFDG